MPKTTMLPTPLRLAMLTAVLLLSLGACATISVPVDSPLSGRWQLDAPASDNVEATIQQSISSAEAKLRKRRDRQGATAVRRGNGGGAHPDEDFDAPSDQFGNLGAIGPDFRQLHDLLLQSLTAPSLLVIQVQSGLVNLQHDNLPARGYRPGETDTRFEEYGTSQLQARWLDSAFVLREAYTSGAKLVERYAIDAHDGTLSYTRTLQDPTVGKLVLKSVYRRG